MKRREFFDMLSRNALSGLSAASAFTKASLLAAGSAEARHWIDAATAKGWHSHWKKFILDAAAKN
jgi:hypothetical protein